MLVTLAGMVIEVKLYEFMNALSPMMVRPFGRVMDVKLDAPENARDPRLVTLDPITTDEISVTLTDE